MRVLFLNPVGTIGGAERVLLDVLAALRRDAPTIALDLAVGSDGPLIDRARSLDVDTTLLEIPSALARLGDSALSGGGAASTVRFAVGGAAALASARRYAVGLRQLVRRRAPSVVHSNGLKCHFLAALAVGPTVPVVWHMHDYVGARALMRRLLRVTSRRANGAIAISESVARDVRATLDPLPVEIVYNTVDVERFAPGTACVDLDLLAGLEPAPAHTVRVGLVATYGRWKGHDVFLDAVARVPRDAPARFYVVGGPIYLTGGSQFSREELDARARELGVADRVGFVPFQAEMTGAYRALDVVVHASTRPEPFGLVIAEAMACGRAVVLSSDSGAAELLEPYRDAVFVQPGDTNALATALGALVRDDEGRRTLGERARNLSVKLYSNRRVGEEVVSAYARFVPALRSATGFAVAHGADGARRDLVRASTTSSQAPRPDRLG